MIRITEAAARSTIQDRGRFGHLRSGVPPSGAADPFALAAANALVGNADDAAGIEIIGTAFRFTCDDARVVAVAGRDVSLATRTRLPGWTSVFVRAGQTVTVHAGERTFHSNTARWIHPLGVSGPRVQPIDSVTFCTQARPATLAQR